MESVKEDKLHPKTARQLSEMPNEGVVEVRAKKPARMGTITIREIRDPDSKGEVIPFYYGNGESGRIDKITEPITRLDLSNDDDRMMYAHLMVHPYITAGSKARLEVRDVTKESREKVSKERKVFEAKKIIMELEDGREDKFDDFCRLMGVNPQENKDVKTAQLFRLCEDRPDSVMSEYKGQDKHLKVLLRKGEDKGVFTEKKGVWKYGDIVIGGSEDDALLWLKDGEGKELLPRIRDKVLNDDQ